jgi:hypothetical protein
MRIFTSILCITLFLLSGCVSEEEIKLRNEKSNKNAQATLDKGGTYIGKLKDGRSITRYALKREFEHVHFVYVVEDSSSITANSTHKEGKHTRDDVHVFINGLEYKPVLEQANED